MTNFLSHINSEGEVQMVDVSEKKISLRIATAEGKVILSPETCGKISRDGSSKGNIIATAKIAGIMAAKQTGLLIPLCHPLALKKIDVSIHLNEDLYCYEITATVKTKGETGVEMEALTAVSVSALTLYDMIKAIDKSIIISDIRLIHKSGGKSDYQLT